MWRVTESIDSRELGTATLHEESDEAVDALITLVQNHLTSVRDEFGNPSWAEINLAEEAGLWFTPATADMLKRYLDGAEGVGGDMTAAPTNNLHVSIGTWTFSLHPVYPVDDVMVEFAGEGH